MRSKVSFESSEGVDLAGVLHEPDTGPIEAYALFAHCFTCTKDINAAVNIANALAQNGIATLRFDFTGLGTSEGDFSDTSFSTDVKDLIHAAKFMEETYQAPQILIGHSLGGTAVLAAAAQIKSAKAVATIGSPASPAHVLHNFDDTLEELNQKGEVTIDLAGRPFTFKQDFVDDVRDFEMDIENLGTALMVMHAPQDGHVSIDQATEIFLAARHPKSFVTLDKADHLLSKSEDSRYVGALLASWAQHYITPIDAADGDDETPGVTVSGQTSEGFYTIGNTSDHTFIIDEPKSYGGTNKGPTPYDYLSAALGSCTSMTLNVYARRKEIDVSRVAVRVTHDRIHADDCDTCEKTEGRVDQFTRYITIEGNITKEQQDRMMQIADKCPVHKTLENEIKIVTQQQD